MSSAGSTVNASRLSRDTLFSHRLQDFVSVAPGLTRRTGSIGCTGERFRPTMQKPTMRNTKITVSIYVKLQPL